MLPGMCCRGTFLSVVFSLLSIFLVSAIHAASIQSGDIAPLNNPDGVLNAGDVVVMERFVLGQLQPTQGRSCARRRRLER